MNAAIMAFLVLTFINGILTTFSFIPYFRKSKWLMAFVTVFSALALVLLIFYITISYFTLPSIIVHSIIVVFGILSLIFD